MALAKADWKQPLVIRRHPISKNHLNFSAQFRIKCTFDPMRMKAMTMSPKNLQRTLKIGYRKNKPYDDMEK